MTESSPPRVCAVVVSYNRRDLLSQTLAGILTGRRLPDELIVVDNASTDGSDTVVRAFEAPFEVRLVSLSRNTGGAGGFTVGINEAMGSGADLVWVMDDDTVPQENTLDALVRAWASYAEIPSGRPAFVASQVRWEDGREHPMNTPRQRPDASSSAVRSAARVGAVPVRSASFVSLLMDAKDIRRVGLPLADYFLWNDDFEYTTRLARHGTGLFLPASQVRHLTKTFGSTDADPGDRFFWEVRNKTWLFGRSHCLSPAEKVLYGGATALRWAKTVAWSKRPGRLVAHLGRGLAAGCGGAPRPNDEVLADAAGPGAFRDPGPAPREPLTEPPTGRDQEDLPDFSVLLPVYYKDQPHHFREALDSVTSGQTVKPSQVVVVLDGPVYPEVSGLLRERREAGDGIEYTVVPLERNVGLAAALDEGMSRCRHEVVARMDADDISLPHRFERQLPLLAAGFDLVGSALREFSEHEDDILADRPMPLTQAEITRQAKFRTPFNHPTVVYRKSAVAAAGGYRQLHLLEDYWLFVRMIEAGARVANLEEPLLLYRISEGAYGRRGGRAVLKSEFALQNHFLGEGFTNPLEWARNLSVRGSYRLIPEQWRKKAYRSIIAEMKGDRAGGEAP